MLRKLCSRLYCEFKILVAYLCLIQDANRHIVTCHSTNYIRFCKHEYSCDSKYSDGSTVAIIVILDMTPCSLVEILLRKVGKFIQDYVFSDPKCG